MRTILIVEDEQPIRTLVGIALNRAGFNLLEAGDAYQAKTQLALDLPQLILMDWMLPDMSGLELVQLLKRNPQFQPIPVIMLTAKAEETDKVQCFKAGVDDYLTKPFYPSELIARIEAVLRRTHAPLPSSQAISFDGLQLDPISHRATANQVLLDLGPTEFRLLKFFMQHHERVYSREALLAYVWERGLYVEERTVDVHILRLRKALMPFGYDHYVQTVRGVGYRFSPYPQLMLQQSESM